MYVYIYICQHRHQIFFETSLAACSCLLLGIQLLLKLCAFIRKVHSICHSLIGKVHRVYYSLIGKVQSICHSLIGKVEDIYHQSLGQWMGKHALVPAPSIILSRI